MKKVLFIFLLLIGIYSCSDDDSTPVLEIEGNKELSIDQQGGKHAVYFKSNSKDIVLTVDEAGGNWCTAEVIDTRVIITATYNPLENLRTATITVAAGQNTSVITVTQQGVGTIAMDDKLKISDGEASSSETVNDKTGFENSYDGDLATFWHTKWSDKPPYTITYNLRDAERLDYLMYYPRTPNGGNGNFGEVEIYVSTEAAPAFTKVMTHDFGRSGSPAKVTLPASVSKPKAVRFIILSGANNNASCSEMEFYSKGSGTVVPKDIPLGGNSFVTASEGSGGGSVSDAGFISWKSTATVFSTYFKINRSGDLRLYLKYRADGDGNVIETTVRGHKFEVALPLPKTRMDTIVLLGVIEKVDPGYAQVDLKGVTLKGTTFATVTNLLVSGSSTEGMNYVKEGFSYHFGRRGPSVHMRYTVPAGHTAEWFYNEVTVPEGNDHVGSYYMANGFSEGYFGMQVNSATERRILFSVWSPYETDDPSTIPDEDRVKL
ncbi:MAG: DUF5077 domain-containing protein, partial [Prevotella sp.]|nr:DUF5077 domain-containing protein [Prevotella sp.]